MVTFLYLLHSAHRLAVCFDLLAIESVAPMSRPAWPTKSNASYASHLVTSTVQPRVVERFSLSILTSGRTRSQPVLHHTRTGGLWHAPCAARPLSSLKRRLLLSNSNSSRTHPASDTDYVANTIQLGSSACSGEQCARVLPYQLRQYSERTHRSSCEPRGIGSA
jgi:hypothetical protein